SDRAFALRPRRGAVSRGRGARVATASFHSSGDCISHKDLIQCRQSTAYRRFGHAGNVRSVSSQGWRDTAHGRQSNE
ncbi:MAG TPA: hypothetical protein VL635_02890, partial [Trinickia sp.]|nr:hypothetical protein [Trinickia sp.]